MKKTLHGSLRLGCCFHFAPVKNPHRKMILPIRPVIRQNYFMPAKTFRIIHCRCVAIDKAIGTDVSQRTDTITYQMKLSVSQMVSLQHI